jgi:hypothetical protein
MGTAVALKGLRVYLVTVDPLRSSRAGRRGRSSFDPLIAFAAVSFLYLIAPGSASSRPFSPEVPIHQSAIGMPWKIPGSGEIRAGADPKGSGVVSARPAGRWG